MFQLPNRYSLSGFLARALRLWHHEKAYSNEEIRVLLKHGNFDAIHVAREHVVPAQVKRVSSALNNVFNKNCQRTYVLDKLLAKTPLSLVSQGYMIVSKKK